MTTEIICPNCTKNLSKAIRQAREEERKRILEIIQTCMLNFAFNNKKTMINCSWTEIEEDLFNKIEKTEGKND